MRILAIDQGTSGTKALLVDGDGTVIATAERPLRPSYGTGGSVEQDPGAMLASVREAGLEACGGVPPDIVALANQGESVLAWDPQSGRPHTPVIVWQDSRAQGVCDRLADRADAIAARTGLVLDPYFSAPKMTWVRENRTREGVVTTTDAWLVHALTGALVTDATTASRSLLVDVDTVTWDPTLLDDFGLGDEQLPRLVRCDEIVGTTTMFGGEVPVGGLIVDQQAALLAESCLELGQAKCTYGTGAFLLAQAGDRAVRSASGLSTSVAWDVDGSRRWCLDGQVFTAASAVRWLVDIGLLADAAQLDAACAPDAGGVLAVPALAGLGAPWWQPQATASFHALSLATTSAELVRAVVEGIAAQVAVLCAAMERDLGAAMPALRVDGGLTRSRVLLQAQADLLQVPVEVYPTPDATALGAAALARRALEPGLSLEQAVGSWTPTAVVEPQWSADRAADTLARWQQAREAAA